MEDRDIIALYFARDEQAIAETEKKYSSYLRKIAWNILEDQEDCRECENDTYLKAWNAIPPANPPVLSAFLARIVRDAAIDRWRLLHRKKRGGSELLLSLDELKEIAPDGQSTEETVEYRELTQLIEKYLRSCGKETRIIFLMRYFYMDPLKDICRSTGFSQAKVKSILYRARSGLKEYLGKEGYPV